MRCICDKFLTTNEHTMKYNGGKFINTSNIYVNFYLICIQNEYKFYLKCYLSSENNNYL